MMRTTRASASAGGAAAAVPPEEADAAMAPEEDSTKTTLPRPKMDWSAFVAGLVVLAEEANIPTVTPAAKKRYGSRAKLLKANEKYLGQLHGAYKFVEEEVFHGPEKGFLMGLPLLLFASGFPTLMKSIVDAVLQLMPFFKNGLAMWGYVAGFIDGDGSINGALTEVRRPHVALAIGNDTTFHKLLVLMGFGSSQSEATLPFMQKHFFPEEDDERAGAKERKTMFTGFNRFLVFRRVQWHVIFLFASMAGLGLHAEFLEDGMRYARAALPWILSSLNHNHNAGMGMEFFYERFQTMEGFPPLVGYSLPPIFLFLYIAGFWGADGTVGMTGNSRNGECGLFQSHENYLKAIAMILNKVLRFPTGEELTVTQRTRGGSGATRTKFRITFNLQQVERIIFPIGSFDYNRRSQWAVLLLLIMVQKDKDIPGATKKKLVRFLKDLLIIIKILRPSKGKRRIIISANGVTISDQTITVYSP